MADFDLAIIGGGIIVFFLIGFFVIHAVIGSGGASTPRHSSHTIPAGDTSRYGLAHSGIEEVAAAPRPLALTGYLFWKGSPVLRPATSADTMPLYVFMRSSANQRMVG